MTLAETVRSLASPRVLVAGDLVLDRYVFGRMGRISAEAPIGILHAAEEESRLGCAASAARNLAVLGAQVRLFGFVGEDDRGRELLGLAEAAGIDVSGVRRVAARATTLKTRFLARRSAGGQQVLRVDWEDTSPYPEEAGADLWGGMLGAMAEADLVVLSDYAKGTLGRPLTRVILEATREAGVPVLVDPKPPAYRRYRGACAVTPNRPEASEWVGFPVDSLDAAESAAKKIMEDLGVEAVVLKLDRDGIVLASRVDGVAHFPIVPREIFDVTGAGDVVIAALAMAIASGAGFPEAVRLANLAAGIEVGRLGVVAVSRAELLEAVHEEKVVVGGVPAIDEVLEILDGRRQRGERIVFTNGCYDVVHTGHVRLLRAARAEGDALVVGLNSDASTRRLKGDGRPVIPEAERAEMLLSLSCVDHVVVFDEDTPLDIIRRVMPDVLVKGEDWREKGVVGREFVEYHGGRVVLVPLTPGRSTTEILKRIRKDGA